MTTKTMPKNTSCLWKTPSAPVYGGLKPPFTKYRLPPIRNPAPRPHPNCFLNPAPSLPSRRAAGRRNTQIGGRAMGGESPGTGTQSRQTRQRVRVQQVKHCKTLLFHERPAALGADKTGYYIFHFRRQVCQRRRRVEWPEPVVCPVTLSGCRNRSIAKPRDTRISQCLAPNPARQLSGKLHGGKRQEIHSGPSQLSPSTLELTEPHQSFFRASMWCCAPAYSEKYAIRYCAPPP